MRNPLQKMRESDLKVFVGESLALARTALGKRQMDWVRQYPQYLTSAGKLQNWESGANFPSPMFLLALCDDHGFSMDWFYRRDRAGLEGATAQLLRQADTPLDS